MTMNQTTEAAISNYRRALWERLKELGIPEPEDDLECEREILNGMEPQEWEMVLAAYYRLLAECDRSESLLRTLFCESDPHSRQESIVIFLKYSQQTPEVKAAAAAYNREAIRLRALRNGVTLDPNYPDHYVVVEKRN